MTDDLQMKYDSLCYATMMNIGSFSKGANKICLKEFDPKDDEHLLVLSVAVACSGILGERPIALDCHKKAIRGFAKKYKKTVKIIQADEDETIVVDVPKMLEFMRGPAKEMCGEDFTFGDIYREYYAEKGE